MRKGVGAWIRALLLPSLQPMLAKAMIKMPDLAESIASAMVCDLELIMMPRDRLLDCQVYQAFRAQIGPLFSRTNFISSHHATTSPAYHYWHPFFDRLVSLWHDTRPRR